MDASSVADDRANSSPSGGPRTLVLVGCIGTGKSATGNSILQKEAFVSKINSTRVTHTCELHTTVLEDGQILHVIDTPGFYSDKTEFVGKEIPKCVVNMAEDGIHAFLLVVSIKSRFSAEEAAVFYSLKTLFGNKMSDYMIIVFTGGDELEYHENTLEDYLGHACPEPLKEVLHQCDNRRVLFDNRTLDQRKKNEQVQELQTLVNLVVAKNGGKPYTDEFMELKIGAMKLHDQTEELFNQENEERVIKQLTEPVELRVTESTTRLEQLLEEQATGLNAEKMVHAEPLKVELKVTDSTSRLEQQLLEEEATGLNAEKIVHAVEKDSNEEMCESSESLERAEHAGALEPSSEDMTNSSPSTNGDHNKD